MPPDSAVTKEPKVRPRLVAEAMPTTMPAPAQGMATTMAPREPLSRALSESTKTLRMDLKAPFMPVALKPSSSWVIRPNTMVTRMASRVAELSARPDMIW